MSERNSTKLLIDLTLSDCGCRAITFFAASIISYPSIKLSNDNKLRMFNEVNVIAINAIQPEDRSLSGIF